mmetsp:Transcript_24316/g.67609  ORF Transcript_24316/g.67609 Transcript_24316/m.67609 type:complete len:250 (+) Transcript_24316:332-1081(+)
MDKAVLDLLHRLPQSNMTSNLAALRQLVPSEKAKDLLQAAEQPLGAAFDEEANKEFVCCEFNRDGDSFRSPWTNRYVPARENGHTPSPELRALEEDANDIFNEYRRMYYAGGVSSVYMWSINDGFAACFAVKKEVGSRGAACWDISHLVKAARNQDETFTYEISTTLILSASSVLDSHACGAFDLGGTIKRELRETAALGDGHIVNIGRIIEKVETNLRNMIGEVYIGKIRDAIHALRIPEEEIRPRGM